MSCANILTSGLAHSMQRWTDLVLIGGWRRISPSPLTSKTVWISCSGSSRLRNIEIWDSQMNGFCQLVHFPQILHWSIVLSSSLLDGQQGAFQTDWRVLSILASRRHLIGILISSMTSELMEHCLTEMGISPDICCTMLGGTCLATPGGLSSAQTVGISWINNFFNSPSGEWVEYWKNRYSSLTGKVIVKALEGPPNCN